MSPEFSAAVDPIFAYVLSTMDEIEGGKTLLAEDISTRIRGLIDQAEHRLGQREEWELAKYALVAWVDDLMIEAPWEGRAWWERNRLEFQFFRTADAFTVFYLKAAESAKVSRKDALEVFYICVVLGFRGIYGDTNAISHIDEFGLPASLEEWARRTALAIQLGQGRPVLLEQGRPGPGAPPLEGKYLFIGSMLFLVVLSAITIATAKRLLGS
jgi:type VI secretion system protein ImpK